MFGEKRTNRLDMPRQLRVGARLGQVIRELAERECRTIQQQMVVLLTKGIEQHGRETGNDFLRRFGQSASERESQ